MHRSFLRASVSLVKFKKCSIGNLSEPTSNFRKGFQKNIIDFDSCELNSLSLAKFSGEVKITNSNINLIYTDSLFNANIRMIGNPSFKYGIFQNSRNLELDIQRTDFINSAEIRAFNSSFNEISFGASDKSGLSLLFQNDSLFGKFLTYSVLGDSFFIDQGKKHQFKNEFIFQNCHIDADFIFFQEIPNSIFTFDKCSFGLNAYLGEMWATRINFINCLNIPQQIPLGLFSRNPKVLTSFINTDVDKFRMNLNSNVKFVFDSGYGKDVIHNSYQRLLNKFSSEGKPDSYKNVDIQFQQYKNGSFQNFLQRNWWYYGYRKYYVWSWTLGFLISFFIFNVIFWKQMQKEYPVISDYKKRKHENKLINMFREGFVISLFTIYVFFSLRISLDKLKFEKVRFVAAFFIQYAVGLWCLFFIFRAVLKF
jgi:hypothetical protein